MPGVIARRKRPYSDEENPYWISFSDIMAGLLVLFVLAALALILELTETKIEVSSELIKLAEAEQARRDIINEVKDELEKKNIKVEISENHTVLRIPENVLSFETNRYRIPDDPDVESTVFLIGLALQNAITKDQRWKYLDTVFVEGHTDIRPSQRTMGNWGLSTYRAISVWNFWEEYLPADEKLSTLMNHDSEDRLFSVSGYGATRLISDVHSENRRIDIRFTIKRPGSEELNRIMERLAG